MIQGGLLETVVTVSDITEGLFSEGLIIFEKIGDPLKCCFEAFRGCHGINWTSMYFAH